MVRGSVRPLTLHERPCAQRAQYPLIKQCTSNYKGLNIMIQGIFLN